MTEPGIKLPSGADELLKNLPLPEPDFEAQAKAIEITLGVRPVPSLSDDDLFRAPDLAAEAGEPPLPSQVRASAPKSNFAEMARKSVQKQEDDSAALAKELLAATAQSRRPNAEMVERIRAAGKVAPTSTPLPSSQPRGERNSGVVSRTEATPTAKAEPAIARASAKPANDNRGVIIGVAGVLVAIAACVALFVKTNDAPSPTAAAVAAEQAAAATTPHAVAPSAPATAKHEDGVVSLEQLERTEAKATDDAPHGMTGSKSVAAGAKPAVAPSASVAAIKQEAVDLEEDPTPPQPVAKAPAEEPALTPAAAEPRAGNAPLTPSSGAVSTALSSVRSGAQACLAGQTEPVSAVVTFASDGHVLRVSAGGPAGSCIQAALSKARIAPFSKDSFSAPTTIRPP
jgi:hypothetical protein